MNFQPGIIETIVVTSDEPWGDIWHTQLHYAFQLSKRCKVIFTDPPKPWKISNLFGFRAEVRNISGTLTVFRYKNILPSFFGRISLRINDFFNELLLQNQIPGFTKNSRMLVWHFDPFRSHYIFRNSGISHIFHVVDPIIGYHMNEEMARKADLVILTSPKFLIDYRKLNQNVIQIGQGVDLDFFAKQFSSPELSSLVSYDSILLLGTFSDEIDYRFLHLLAARYPGKLVLIGPDKTSDPVIKSSLNQLKATHGVHWLGKMSPAEFHIHLVACRVGIITYTYKNYERNNLRSPLKIISYLACGKCVVSNIDCEVPSLKNKAIYIVDNDQSCFDLLDASYNNSLAFDVVAVQSYLNEIDYPKLISSIFSRLGEQLPSEKLTSQQGCN